MSLISKESTGTNQYKLSIKIDGDVLSGEIDKVISKMRSNVNVPGFRKGKAPVSVIREYFGDDRFYEEAMENLVNDAYSAAAEESGLDIVSDPYEYEQGEIGVEGAEFSVKVDVRPSVTVGEYHGLHAEKV
ncbi:MAG: trigger factor family protein, partial [Clostridia bacterium]|nr:trigger factor family protein [Clostridia bacterium]